MTRAGRLRALAGLAAIAAMMAAEGFAAQDCREWLTRSCSDSASSNAAARKGVRQEKQLAGTIANSKSGMDRKTKQARGAAPDSATNSKSQQTQTLKRARPANAARDASGDRRLARHGERQGTHLAPAMNDQEKEMLFEQFLEWEKGARRNTETNR
jgi:hypothetical protein